MTRTLCTIFLALLLSLGAGAKGKRTSAQAQRQRQQTEREAAQTARDLKANEAELSANLRKLTELERSIDVTHAQMSVLRARMDSIGSRMAAVEDSIADNEGQLKRLRDLYVTAVRSARRNRRELNASTFILSARTFSQAERRMRYLREFSGWRERKAAQIDTIRRQLETQREALELMQRQTQALVSELAGQERKLRADRSRLDEVADKLRGKQKQLNAMLRKQQAAIVKLDREIQRLIEQELAEQRRKEEEERRKREREQRQNAAANAPQEPGYTPAPQQTAPQSGGFDKQKGKLPSPLDHTYKIALGFGIQTHRTVKTSQIDNSGIDLESSLGAKALAVYSGTVTAVYKQPGLNYIVLIRHGSYITVYANLESISVAKGKSVKAGDAIGVAAPSPFNPQCSQLHFEIRRERQKLDPAQWLKR